MFAVIIIQIMNYRYSEFVLYYLLSLKVIIFIICTIKEVVNIPIVLVA